MKCLECDRELRQISFNHLKYCCGLTQKQYKEKHNIDPTTALMDEDVRLNCARKDEQNGR
jgi:hypothetical protein